MGVFHSSSYHGWLHSWFSVLQSWGTCLRLLKLSILECVQLNQSGRVKSNLSYLSSMNTIITYYYNIFTPPSIPVSCPSNLTLSSNNINILKRCGMASMNDGSKILLLWWTLMFSLVVVLLHSSHQFFLKQVHHEFWCVRPPSGLDQSWMKRKLNPNANTGY